MRDYRLILAKDANPTGFKLAGVQLSDKAAIAIDNMLEETSELSTITNDKDKELFISAQISIDDLLGMLERNRKEIKEPFFAACKLIDATAKGIALPLERESERLRAELSRIYVEQRRRELKEKEQLEELAGKARLAAIREEDYDTAEKLNKMSATAQAAAATVVTPVAGLAIRIGWAVEKIVDPVKVLETNPHLVEVSPRRSAIQDMIRSLEERGAQIKEDIIPGIRLKPISTVSTRR